MGQVTEAFNKRASSVCTVTRIRDMIRNEDIGKRKLGLFGSVISPE